MNRQSVSLARGDGRLDAEELARAATAAAALLDPAIREPLAPAETLGRTLSHSAAARSSAAERGAELAACIESPQLHDRLVQQLTRVRDLLAGTAAAYPPANDSCGWPAQREQLRGHFTCEPHRMVLNVLMPGNPAGVPVRLHAG